VRKTSNALQLLVSWQLQLMRWQLLMRQVDDDAAATAAAAEAAGA